MAETFQARRVDDGRWAVFMVAADSPISLDGVPMVGLTPNRARTVARALNAGMRIMARAGLTPPSLH